MKDAKRDAMKDFLAAVEAKDSKAMALAFTRAHEACAYDKDDEEDDESEEK